MEDILDRFTPLAGGFKPSIYIYIYWDNQRQAQLSSAPALVAPLGELDAHGGADWSVLVSLRFVNLHWSPISPSFLRQVSP